MVTINELAELIMQVAGKRLKLRHIPGPLGVRGRNSHNQLISEMLGWKPSQALRAGIEETYLWIEAQVLHARGSTMIQEAAQ